VVLTYPMVNSCFVGSNTAVEIQTALCRASAAHQSVVLIGRMGANCPSAVPCLLRGCIDAFVTATSDDTKAHATIANTAKAAVRSLASLSRRESFRTRTILQQSNVMVDVQLELAIGQDPIVAACLLNTHLSKYALLRLKEESTQLDIAAEKRGDSWQRPSDSPSEAPFMGKDMNYVTGPLTGQSKTASLKWLLEDNPVLLRKSFACILEAIRNSNETSTSSKLSGRTIILLRAFSFLMLFGGAWKVDSTGDLFTSDVIEGVCRELDLLRCEIFKKATDTDQEAASKSENDDYYRYLVCACLSMHARVAFASGDAGSLPVSTDKCLDFVFDTRSISLRSDVFSSKVASMLKSSRGIAVCDLILDTLTAETGCSFHDKAMDEGFVAMCKAACSLPNLDSIIQKGITDAAAMEDSSALLLHVEAERNYIRADQFTRSILNDPVRSNKMLNSKDICHVLQSAVVAIKTRGGSTIPHILPVQLQSLSLKIDWRKDDTRSPQPSLDSQYLLQTLYCLYFVDEIPKSSFAIDPRDLPLKETLELAEWRLEHNHVTFEVESELQRLVEKLAPEVSSQIDMAVVRGESTSAKALASTSGQSFRYTHCNALSDSIREGIRDMDKDPSGTLAEKAFAYASRQLTSSDLMLTAVKALVASPNVPLPFMTYPGLCKDPLVLLKVPVAVWRCKGLRRIALCILSNLLRANDSLIANMSLTDGVAAEVLLSRDAIIVKCLIMASVGGVGRDRLRPFTDSMLIAMVRGMVARHVGLVAQLVKHGRNDTIVDW